MVGFDHGEDGEGKGIQRQKVGGVLSGETLLLLGHQGIHEVLSFLLNLLWLLSINQKHKNV